MRKYFKIILAVLFVLAVNACRTRYDSNPVSLSEKEGTITIISTGAGATMKRARLDAEKQAFNALFFRGFPPSSQKIPLIGYNEAAIQQQHKAYFDQLYGKRRYWSFVIHSKPIDSEAGGGLLGIGSQVVNTALSYAVTSLSDAELLGAKAKQTIMITINLRALRTDLEQNGVIRKFGY
ncbi:MAG: hypothetical protein LBN11_00860 [Tannerella sp.]|jgi:hypothetical protein|nr:hypothetical protein [Tannerella sp.]